MRVLTEKLREWAGVGAFLFILTVVLLFGTLSARQAEREHERVAQTIRTEIVDHGHASANRTCASTKLLAFIIFTSNQRAHDLDTNNYLRPREKKEIRGFVRDACLFVDPKGEV